MSWWKKILEWLTGNRLPDIKNHKASFLMDNGNLRLMNILSPKCDRGTFKSVVARSKANGDNFMYLYVINEHDGGWTPYSIYMDNKIGGAKDHAVIAEYEWRLKHIREQRMGIVLWLRADDSPNFNKTPEPQQRSYQADVVKHFDDYVSAYVVGLEADEYMTGSAVEMYAVHLRSLTKKHIGVHQRQGRWDYALLPHIDGLWYQYGFNKTPDQVRNDTVTVKQRLGGKALYAAEYHLSSDTEAAKRLGDAANAGGALGTGNGRH